MNDPEPSTNLTAHTERFVELFTSHQRHIYVFIRAQLPNAADVDEVWQATNLILWKKFADYQPGTHFRAWALQIARYEILNFRTRSDRHSMLFSEGLLEKLSEEALDDSAADDRLAALKECLQKLAPVDREIISQRFAAGATGECVAAAMGRTPHYVYKAVSRIRRLLIECVARQLVREEHPS